MGGISRPVHSCLAVVFVAGFLVVTWIRIGPAFAMLFAVPSGLAFVAWRRTIREKPASRKIIALYFTTVACLHVHILEEYLSQFPQRLSQLFHLAHFSESAFLEMFAFGGIILWIIVGVGLICRIPLANYFAWFVFIGPGPGELIHYVFPLIEGGHYHYFPGMWTAWIPVVPAILAMFTLFRDARSEEKSRDL